MQEGRSFRVMAWLSLASGLLAGCSMGGGGSPFSKASDHDRTFIAAAQTWDLNKDGIVTCAEWNDYVAQSHREADGNGDGSLDADEWARLVRGDRLFEVANIKHYDKNGDGRVSLEEMTSTPNKAFQLLDRNQDCQIDRTEAVQVHGIDKVKPKDSGGSGMPRGGPGGPGGM